MKSVLEVLQSTTAYFGRNGIENPRLNIEHLLAFVLGKKRMELYLEFDRVLTAAELEPLRDLVRRRVAGEPLQHLLGTVEFLGRIFKSDSRALIPRPETEQLIEMIRAEHRPHHRVLDVGTGSGVIALSLAAEFPAAHVEGIDVSPEALTLARENAERIGLQERVVFRESNLLENVTGEFDLIVANLPYIETAEIPKLAREVQREPLVALDGGPQGLTLIEELIAKARNHLRGVLALEIGLDQAPRLSDTLAAENYHHIRPACDYHGRSRFLFAQYG